jgi:NAD(P)-dependent dehydrogenase (short-subunit alcohol dehydrogenase family)
MKRLDKIRICPREYRQRSGVAPRILPRRAGADKVPAQGSNEEDMQRPNFSLDGRVAVITGGARGIGGAIASAVSAAGAAVALLGRDEHALAEAAATLTAAGCNAEYFPADVTHVPSIETAFDGVLRSMGRIDILVNNAGIEQVCALSMSPRRCGIVSSAPTSRVRSSPPRQRAAACSSAAASSTSAR